MDDPEGVIMCSSRTAAIAEVSKLVNVDTVESDGVFGVKTGDIDQEVCGPSPQLGQEGTKRVSLIR